MKQGDDAGARLILARTLDASRRARGEKHPDTLKYMYNMAFLMADTEDREDAVRLLRECLLGRREVLGEDHPDTVDTVKFLRRLGAVA